MFLCQYVNERMIRKISHIVISILLLVLTMGFSVSKHYCQGNLVDVSVFSKGTDGCSMDMSMDTNASKGSCSLDNNCCRNEHSVYQLDKTYTSQVVLAHVPFFQIDLAILDLSLITPQVDENKTTDYFSGAKSPPPEGVLSALSNLQTYRL